LVRGCSRCFHRHFFTIATEHCHKISLQAVTLTVTRTWKCKSATKQVSPRVSRKQSVPLRSFDTRSKASDRLGVNFAMIAGLLTQNFGVEQLDTHCKGLIIDQAVVQQRRNDSGCAESLVLVGCIQHHTQKVSAKGHLDDGRDGLGSTRRLP
jgi:hypothetical protein